MTRSIDWHLAIKVTIAAFASLVASHLFFLIFLPGHKAVGGGVWSLVAAILMMRKSLGDTYKFAIKRFFGILIGSTIATIVITFFQPSYINLSIALFLTVSFCSLFRLEDSTRIACTSVATVILFWKANSPTTSTLLFGGLRFIEGCIGMCVGVIVASYVFPIRTKKIFETEALEIVDLFNEACNLIGCHRCRLSVDKDVPEAPSMDLTQKLESVLPKIRKHIDKLASNFDVLKLEVTVEEMRGESATLIEWRQLIGYFENIMRHFIQIKHTYPLLKEFDEHINSVLDQVFTDFEISFIHIHKKIENGKEAAGEIKPGISIEALHSAFYTYYQKRTVNSLELMKKEETFFLFFYTIKEMSYDLNKIDHSINRLYV